MGPRKLDWKRSSSELGLGDIVFLLGRRLDTPDILAALDVAVCASHFEGSPLAVMEYMEAGLPIVATRVGGVPDLIEDGVHGLLVEPGSPVELAQAIEDLLSDRARASALGARARERRRREFDLDVMVRNVEALYEELLAASSHSVREIRCPHKRKAINKQLTAPLGLVAALRWISSK